MKVSVVIPVFNSGALLRTTLNSIAWAGGDDVEVIVVDGGSVDETAEVVASFAELVTQFLSEPDEGQYDAINKGMALATGDILCWINGGDFFLPGAISNVTTAFSAFPEIEWVCGRPCVSEGESLRWLGLSEVVVSNFEIRYGMCCSGYSGYIQQEGMFWSRKLWEESGGLDLTYHLAGDFELWMRFARRADLVRLEVPLAAFSYHETNRSIVQQSSYNEEVKRAIAELPIPSQRLRLLMRWFPLLMRAIHKFGIGRSLAWISLRLFGRRMSVAVILWRRTGDSGFGILKKRKVAWTR